MSGTGAAAAPDTNSVFDVDKIAEVDCMDFGRISGTRVSAVTVDMTSDCKVLFDAIPYETPVTNISV
jgi:hypothetical protein